MDAKPNGDQADEADAANAANDDADDIDKVAPCATCNEPIPKTARFCTYCGAPTPRFVPPPPGPSPSVRRARRRRWRRAIGVLAFVALAAVVVGIAAAAMSDSDNESADGTLTRNRPTFATTTPPIPPAGPFKVTDGVFVRSGPGTSFSNISTIDLGKEVLVVCVVEGEAVNTPAGPNTRWFRVIAPGVTGYVTSQYVETGPLINNPAVIPVCTEI